MVTSDPEQLTCAWRNDWIALPSFAGRGKPAIKERDKELRYWIGPLVSRLLVWFVEICIPIHVHIWRREHPKGIVDVIIDRERCEVQTQTSRAVCGDKWNSIGWPCGPTFLIKHVPVRTPPTNRCHREGTHWATDDHKQEAVKSQLMSKQEQ